MKLASALPKGHENGLTAIEHDLAGQPEDQHVIVAVVDCSRLTVDTDTGDTEPTIRVLAVEALDDGDADTARRLLMRTKDARTGALPLGLDTESGELGDDEG